MLLTPATRVLPAIFPRAVPDRAHARLEIEAALGGAGTWVDMTADLLMDPTLQFEYGLPGAGPMDLVARTGHMTFALNNAANNSAGLIGYYSPEHANCRAGFQLGIAVRVRYLLGTTTYYKFTGWLDSIDPIPGQYGDRNTICTVVDIMDDYARYKPNVATQISQRSDVVLTALVNATPRQPFARNFDTGDTTFSVALDNMQSESQPVLTQFQAIAQSEDGRIYPRGNTTTGGELCFEKRTARLTPMPTISFDDTMVALSSPFDRSHVVNTVKATIHPRRADTGATTILFSNQGTPRLAFGTTTKITGRYNDPNARAIRVGGMNMVATSSGTDYTMFATSSGGGADLTSNFTVVAAYGANTVEYTITNNSTGTDGFLTKLQARGDGLYDYDAVDVISTDAASIALYGERVLTFNMPFNTVQATAQAVADYIKSVWKDPGSVEVTIGVLGTNDTELASIIPVEPGDAIVIRETLTGIAHTYFVNSVRMEFETPTIVSAEWVCQRAPILAYWTLGVVGYSELGLTTVMAPL